MDGFMLTQQYSAISVMKISYLYSSVIVSALCILNVGVLPQTLMTVKINGVIFFFFFHLWRNMLWEPYRFGVSTRS